MRVPTPAMKSAHWMRKVLSFPGRSKSAATMRGTVMFAANMAKMCWKARGTAFFSSGLSSILYKISRFSFTSAISLLLYLFRLFFTSCCLLYKYHGHGGEKYHSANDILEVHADDPHDIRVKSLRQGCHVDLHRADLSTKSCGNGHKAHGF